MRTLSLFVISHITGDGIHRKNWPPIKAFQNRHGLTADGVMGRDTFEQLNTPMAARARQIELTLERLRWTPLLLCNRMIVVNIPEFVLRAYEINDGQINMKVTMNVIVGKTLDTRTPVFLEDMRFIEFSPYWNIPPSIAKSETVPKLRGDPAYLNNEGLEFVRGDGQVISKFSKENLEAVISGNSKTIRLKQPLPVVIAYATAIVKRDEKVYFFQDIYGHDTLLDAALKKNGTLIHNQREEVQH